MDLDRPMLWENMTVQEIGAAIDKTRTVLLPLGVIEQHGFHLPVTVDVYNAYEMCKRIAAQADCLVAPPYVYSYSGGELPGTINVHPHVVSLVLEEIVKAFIRQGLKNIIIVHGHGGSEINRSLQTFRDMFFRQNNHLQGIVLAITGAMSQDSPTRLSLRERGEWHASLIETSLMLYWAPHLVKPRDQWAIDQGEIAQRMREDPDAYQESCRPVDRDEVAPYTRQRDDVKVGVMGTLDEADAEIGRKIVEESLPEKVALVKEIQRRNA